MGASESYFFNGSIDEVAIYNRALSANEIKAQYDAVVGPDITPPTISSTDPANNATNVSVNTTIKITFSEPMDKTSAQNAFSISPSISGNFSWDENTNTMIYTLSIPLTRATTYTVGMGTEAKDLAGNPLSSSYNFSFTTDETPPTIFSTDPAINAANVSVYTPIKVSFSEAVDKTSAQDAFLINPSAPGNFSWDGNTMIYTPSVPLSLSTTYTVTIGIGAKDLAGNSLSSTHAFSFTTAAVALDPSLVGYWKFDEGSGTTAFDSSGNGNNGTWSGSGTHYTTGKVGSYAGQFNGSDDYVNGGNGTSLNPTKITLAVWVKANSFGNSKRIIEKAYTSFGEPYSQYNFIIGDTAPYDYFAFQASINGTRKQAAIPHGSVTTGVWYYVVGTFDGTNLRIYLNGIEKAVTSASGNISSYDTNFLIGKMGASESYFFNGSIDEVAIYNRALSAAEIKAQYDAVITPADTTPPTGSISINGGAAYTNNTSITLTLSASDNASGVSKIMVSNDPGFSGASWENYASTKAWTLSSGDGTKTVYVKYKDAAENVSIVYSANITLDTISPVIAITLPADNSYTKVASGNLTGAVDGAPFSDPYTLVEGANTLTKIATDQAGNTSSKSITVNLDTFAPVITITSPADNSYTKVAGGNLTGTVDGAPFSDPYTLVEGANTLTKVATDQAGNSATKSITVNLDTTAPQITINGVTGGQYYKTVTPTISITDTNLDTSSITLDGQPYVSGTAITASGAHTLLVNAADKAGNTASKSVSFTVDNAAPTISITGITDGSYYKTVAANISITDTNLDTQSIKLDGVAYTSGTAITANGIHTLEVTAMDKAGNSASDSVTFIVDNTAPTISITGVTDGSYYKTAAANISITDTNLDTSSIKLDGQIYVNGTPITANGLHTLEVNVADKAGNTATKSVSFVIDKTPPSISITGVEDGKRYATAVTPIISITDANLATSSITLNGSPFTSGTSITAEGYYTLKVAAADKAGNTASASISFTICAAITGNPEVDAAMGVLNNKYTDPKTGLATHGIYVSAVADMVVEMRLAGKLIKNQGAEIVKKAAQSSVNMP
jgi:hypothetical protein